LHNGGRGGKVGVGGGGRRKVVVVVVVVVVFTRNCVRGSQLLQIKLVNPICYTFTVQIEVLRSISMTICMMEESKCFKMIFSVSPAVLLQKS
jgi:hypothetical protein